MRHYFQLLRDSSYLLRSYAEEKERKSSVSISHGYTFRSVAVRCVADTPRLTPVKASSSSPRKHLHLKCIGRREGGGSLFALSTGG